MELMEVYQKGKRDRSENFSKEECNLLLKLVLKRKTILENRKTDNATNAAKNHAWNDMAVEFNAYNEGPTREAKTLKTKYEAIKKYMKKRVLSEAKGGKNKDKDKPTWEEMELREMILENLQQYPQHQQQENSNSSSGVQADETEDWDPLHKSLHEAPVEVMMEDASPAKDEESTGSKYVLQRIGNNTEEDGTLFEPGGDPLSREQKTEPNSSTNQVTRRRYKKRYRPILPAPASKYEDEKTGKLMTLKLETAIIEREIAKTNLAAAKARLRTAEIEEETAMLTKRAKLLSNCKPVPNNNVNSKPSTTLHQNEFGEVFTNL